MRKIVEKFGWRSWQHAIDLRLANADKIVWFPSSAKPGELVCGRMTTPSEADYNPAVDEFVEKALEVIGTHRNVGIDRVKIRTHWDKTFVTAHVAAFD